MQQSYLPPSTVMARLQKSREAFSNNASHSDVKDVTRGRTSEELDLALNYTL